MSNQHYKSTKGTRLWPSKSKQYIHNEKKTMVLQQWFPFTKYRHKMQQYHTTMLRNQRLPLTKHRHEIRVWSNFGYGVESGLRCSFSVDWLWQQSSTECSVTAITQKLAETTDPWTSDLEQAANQVCPVIGKIDDERQKYRHLSLGKPQHWSDAVGTTDIILESATWPKTK